MKEMIEFGKQEKLSPRYMKPYGILSKVGKVTYRLPLPQELFPGS